MNVVDTFLLLNYVETNYRRKRETIIEFSNRLAGKLYVLANEEYLTLNESTKPSTFESNGKRNLARKEDDESSSDEALGCDSIQFELVSRYVYSSERYSCGRHYSWCCSTRSKRGFTTWQCLNYNIPLLRDGTGLRGPSILEHMCFTEYHESEKEKKNDVAAICYNVDSGN